MSRTIILTDTSPVTFAISGQEWSDMMDDGKIYARASSELGEVEAVADVTVLWVEPIDVFSSGTFSDDNHFTAHPNPSTLGPGYYTVPCRLDQNPPSYTRQMAYVVEIRGTVHPSNFDQQVFLTRDWIKEWFWGTDQNGKVLFKEIKTKKRGIDDGTIFGNDDPLGQMGFDSSNPSNGYIFDVDTPGVQKGMIWQHVGDGPGKYAFVRFFDVVNFIQYAYFNGQRVADDHDWSMQLAFDCSFEDGIVQEPHIPDELKEANSIGKVHIEFNKLEDEDEDN